MYNKKIIKKQYTIFIFILREERKQGSIFKKIKYSNG